MDNQNTSTPARLTRRAVLRGGSLLIAGAAGASAALSGCSQLSGGGSRARRPLQVGLLTDLHYADKEPSRTRYYRDSLAKLSSVIESLNRAKTDFVVELGDFIDAADSVEQETGYLRRIESLYRQARCPRHHVLGNHCVYSLTKEQFLAECEERHSYSSFDVAGFHFIILDACFRHDGEPYGKKNFDWIDANIPGAQVEWLKADLKATRLPTIVFVHQRLDVQNHYGIANQVEVRQHLEESGKVRLVLQGHNHINDLREINSIPYCTLTAVVEGPADSNAYALMTLNENGTIRIDGFGRQESRQLRHVG